jgi:hypothetical protein
VSGGGDGGGGCGGGGGEDMSGLSSMASMRDAIKSSSAAAVTRASRTQLGSHAGIV